MAQLARGTVTDRPWGRTLGALGLRGLTGQLAVHAEGKQYLVAFEQGAVVGAFSPLAGDAAVRVALTSGLVSSTQVGEITRRLATTAGRDEVEVLAEAARLGADQTQRLRRRLVAQRAARTFSIESGEFVVDDQITVPVVPGSELDIRAVIYLGARGNVSEERLRREVAQLGAWFQIKPEAVTDLPQYGFTDTEKPVLQLLLEGANLQDLYLEQRDLDARGASAVVYALASCGACVIQAEPQARPGAAPRTHTPSSYPTELRRGQPSPTAPPQARTQTGNPAAPQPARAATGPQPARTQTGNTVAPQPARAPTGPQPARTQTGNPVAPQPTRTSTPHPAPEPVRTKTPTMTPPEPSRTRTPSVPPPDGMSLRTPRTATKTIPPTATVNFGRPRPPTGAVPIVPAPPEPAAPAIPPPGRGRRNTAATLETEALIAEKLPLLEGNADHFALLGVDPQAPIDEIRKSYFVLARKLHPDRLAALGIADDKRAAHRLFAQINAAFAVLNNPAQREEYISILRRGGAAAVRAEEARADELASAVMRAEEAFKRGEMALRRDQLEQAQADFAQAVQLQPLEAEYQALLAWTKFAMAPDKAAVAAQTRKDLQRAAAGAELSPTPKFYLGRVERMLGREREALQYFQQVLAIKPNHAEASSEARVLEQRLKTKR